MTTHGDHGEGRVDVAAERALYRPGTSMYRLLGEVERLRAENARLREALKRISASACSNRRETTAEIACRALGSDINKETA